MSILIFSLMVATSLEALGDVNVTSNPSVELNLGPIEDLINKYEYRKKHNLRMEPPPPALDINQHLRGIRPQERVADGKAKENTKNAQPYQLESMPYQKPVKPSHNIVKHPSDSPKPDLWQKMPGNLKTKGLHDSNNNIGNLPSRQNLLGMHSQPSSSTPFLNKGLQEFSKTRESRKLEQVAPGTLMNNDSAHQSTETDEMLEWPNNPYLPFPPHETLKSIQKKQEDDRAMPDLGEALMSPDPTGEPNEDRASLEYTVPDEIIPTPESGTLHSWETILKPANGFFSTKQDKNEKSSINENKHAKELERDDFSKLPVKQGEEAIKSSNALNPPNQKEPIYLGTGNGTDSSKMQKKTAKKGEAPIITYHQPLPSPKVTLKDLPS